MITAAVFYWTALAVGIPINIRNVCVFVAPIFSALASIASFLLTRYVYSRSNCIETCCRMLIVSGRREVTQRSSAGLLAAAFTAIVPSYISRY